MKFTFLGFHVVVLVNTFPVKYQLPMLDWIGEAKGISALQHKSNTSQNLISNFLKKKSDFLVSMF